MATHVDMDTARGLLVSLQNSANTQLALKGHWASENDIDMAEVSLMEHHAYCDLSYYLGRLILGAEHDDNIDGAEILAELAEYADTMYETLNDWKMGDNNDSHKLVHLALRYRMKVYAFIRDTIWIMIKAAEVEKFTES